MNELIKRSIIKYGLKLLTSLFLVSLPVFSWASDNVEKIFIDADRMQMDINTGISIYAGNVKISQGELILTGDKVTLESNKGEVERITVTGKPARYNHVSETGQTTTAQSEHMVYIASKNKLVMTINAHLQQPELKLSSHKIVYDTQQQIVIAGDGDKAQRVNITLTPKK
jgi:lipopolysaccharide export system protein LptA